MHGVTRVVGALVLLVCASARADRWLVLEAPAVVAVSEVQQGVFRPGVMPAIGGYVSNSWGALGVRLRGGGLLDGPAPGDNLRDPGAGGLLTGALALRLTDGHGWVEAAGGYGVTGTDWVPVVEAGLGWGFPLGAFSVGPSVRYAQVMSRGGDMDTFGTAKLVLLGIDVRFSGSSSRPRAARRAEPRPLAPAPEPLAEVERDHDPLLDREQSCLQQLDGCEPVDGLTIEDDRFILEERVLFALNRARVRHSGRRVMAKIVAMWRQHPEWHRLRIEGHTCDLGTEELNFGLSQLRAERARAALIDLGIDGALLDATGFGSTRPRAEGHGAEARERNRRVEFVIERSIHHDVGHEVGPAAGPDAGPDTGPDAGPAAGPDVGLDLDEVSP